MKQEILKSIINDLNMAGIFDIPANSFMDMQKIETSNLLKKVFNLQDNSSITENNLSQLKNIVSSIDIDNEVTSLFANFNNNLKSDDEPESNNNTVKIETIKAKKVNLEKNDRRQLAKNKRQEKEFIAKNIKREEKIISAKLPEPETFISVKKLNNSQIIIIISEKNETVFKAKEEFKLLENILKSADLTLKDITLIFIDDNYKKVEQHAENYNHRISQVIKKEIIALEDNIIFCFGQDCLRLTLGKNATIKDVVNQIDTEFESKKVFANYSLSAMLNNPKYKRITWNNILKLKD